MREFKAGIATALALLLIMSTAHAAGRANPFFAFCMDTHDSQRRTLDQQARLLKDLGYDGAGHLWLDQVQERLAAQAAASRITVIHCRGFLMPRLLSHGDTVTECFSFLHDKDNWETAAARRISQPCLGAQGRPSA